jgi:hypothetical protein
MSYFTLPNFGAHSAKVSAAFRRVFIGRTAAKAEAARADETAKAKAARAHGAAIAEAEAAQSARIEAILAPLWEAIARVEAKLDAMLAKLG